VKKTKTSSKSTQTKEKGKRGGKKPNVRTQSSNLKEREAPAPRRVPREDDGRSLEAAKRAVASALDKKGLEPVVLDVRDLASYADYIVLVSGRSDRQVQAIADGILDGESAAGRKPIGTEGLRGGHWTLLDFGDVIAHVFYHPARDFYDLESFWVDAPRVPLEIPADARIPAGAEESYFGPK
jgi:ribosome-associated protein